MNNRPHPCRQQYLEFSRKIQLACNKNPGENRGVRGTRCQGHPACESWGGCAWNLVDFPNSSKCSILAISGPVPELILVIDGRSNRFEKDLHEAMCKRLTIAFGFLSLAVFCLHAAGDPVSFDRQIRPILSEACFQCHGPDPESRKAKLRLDTPDGAFADRGGYAAIVPGKPDESELIRRISSHDPDEMMPPPKSGEALSDAEVALIRDWIAQGAEWSMHWAFVPPQRHTVPGVDNPEWARNPIDGFILKRLGAEGLSPTPQADRVTLLRRLSLDLTGLPPTLDEIDRVTSDRSEDWYSALVERLLNSPHYGERWARDWLDASQYADSDGFEKDKPRQVWAWRDWVIRAFNGNMPYDQFVIEQIAGDLLPNPTQDQLVATGFLRNSMINEEGGIDPEQFRMEAQFNRVDIVGRAVLGLTTQCAQCHTHKYDPISHTEYYQMLAFLNNTDEACISVYSPEEQNQRDAILDLIAGIEVTIKQDRPDWRERVADWESTARAVPNPNWETLVLEFDDTSAGGQKCVPLGDDSYLAQGYAPTRFQPKMTATTTLTTITAVRLELLPEPNLPRGGPGRSIYGACALSEFELRVAPADTPIAEYDKWTAVPVASAIADVSPPQEVLGPEFPDKEGTKRYTGPIELAIDGKAETAWTTDIDPEHRNRAHYAIFKLAEPLTIESGMALAFRLSQQHGGWNSDDNQNNNLGRFRLSVTDATDLPGTALPVAAQDALEVDAGARSDAESRAIFSAWRATVPELSEANARIAALWRSLPSGTTQLVMHERENPRATHRLERGDFLKPAEAVEPGVPVFMHALDAGGSPDRLDFARWLVSPESPTTARSFVNRVWQHYFGKGIVETSSDLGTQGDPPSHPELLDWLAVEFMESGWDVKALHRLIVTSAAYRQASKTTPDLLERDPYNRFLARGARFRVSGETVRDIALASSGLLNDRLGGPSVFSPAPEFLFQPPASYGPKIWNTVQGPDRYRRALYTFRYRSVPYPALQVFDTPAGDAPCTRRDRSNSPLQALTTLNEPLFFECARGLAEDTLTHGGDANRPRIEYAFRRCTSRVPEDGEVATLEAFLEKQQSRIAVGELSADSILKSAGWDGGVIDNAAELAAWTLTARVMLNLDEALVRQ